MVYNPNIPQPTDLLSDSQKNILDNFSTANTVMGKDHYPFDDATANKGKHKQVQLVEQGGVPVVSGTQETIYARAISAKGEICFTRGGTGTQIQLTAYGNLPGGLPQAAATGSTFLPGGIFLIWSTFDPHLGSDPFAVTFPFSGFPNNCWNIQVTYECNDNSTIRSGIRAGTLSKTGFQWEGTITSHVQKVYYLAIGN